MTVAELIEELHKHPPHHTVVMETFTPDMESGGMDMKWSCVGEVEGRSTQNGPLVRIVAEVSP